VQYVAYFVRPPQFLHTFRRGLGLPSALKPTRHRQANLLHDLSNIVLLPQKGQTYLRTPLGLRRGLGASFSEASKASNAHEGHLPVSEL
jgi:hypothetical protein